MEASSGDSVVEVPVLALSSIYGGKLWARIIGVLTILYAVLVCGVMFFAMRLFSGVEELSGPNPQTMILGFVVGMVVFFFAVFVYLAVRMFLYAKALSSLQAEQSSSALELMVVRKHRMWRAFAIAGSCFLVLSLIGQVT